MSLQLILTSSLEKVFPDVHPGPAPLKTPLSVLMNDHVSWQAAVFPEKTHFRRRVECRVAVDSPLASWITVRSVRPVPVTLAAFDASDGGYLRDTPGLYPDRLEPLYEDGGFAAISGEWSSLWLELTTVPEVPAGCFPVRITVSDGQEKTSVTVHVTVLPEMLPPQRLKHTEWFHCDGIAQYYREPVWSERYWELVRAQVRTAAARGINMLLVPLWTPPLDTRIGHERLTTQLLTIRRDRDGWHFDLARVRRWLDLCLEEGIEYFEMAHFFTQWGAEKCPKILVEEQGRMVQAFGWETDATGEAYRDFLQALLPVLTDHLRAWGLANRVYFHISDEPSAAQLPQYRACRAMVDDLLKGFPIMDAMSDYSYFASGVCDHPVVALDHLDPFLHRKRPEEFWVYYCCAQGRAVPNRFIAMPSSRSRIIGVLFYKFRIDGFLQWGYNYYNNVTSIRPVDPFATADGEGSYPAGDPFLVYPGPDGRPQESLRLVVLSDALHDLRALERLEALTSREHVLSLIEEGLPQPLSFTCYPLDPGYLTALREKVNREIVSCSTKAKNEEL